MDKPAATDRSLSRRGFLFTSTLAAAGALGASRARAQCELTTPDILGPFHVANAPLRAVLASADEPGTRLFIDGRSFASDCAGPVGGAVVDVWHATDDGCYSVLEECPDEDPFDCAIEIVSGPATPVITA